MGTLEAPLVVLPLLLKGHTMHVQRPF